MAGENRRSLGELYYVPRLTETRLYSFRLAGAQSQDDLIRSFKSTRPQEEAVLLTDRREPQETVQEVHTSDIMDIRDLSKEKSASGLQTPAPAKAEVMQAGTGDIVVDDEELPQVSAELIMPGSISRQTTLKQRRPSSFLTRPKDRGR